MNRRAYILDNFGGISVVEIDYAQDCVWVNGDLYDHYETIDEFLNDYDLYDSLLEAAEAAESGE